MSTDIVRYDNSDGGKLVFEPNLGHPPGIYSIKLKANMKMYPWITAEEYFNVEVYPCQAKIISDQVSIPDVSIVWYDNPQMLPIGQMLNSYYQEPNCEYQMQFNMFAL
jgi:hypothetical protein